jgi:hypothetical protein
MSFHKLNKRGISIGKELRYASITHSFFGSLSLKRLLLLLMFEYFVRVDSVVVIGA